MGQLDRNRHQFGGLVDREPEHDPLIAGSQQVVGVDGAGPGFLGPVDPGGDIGTLPMDEDVHLDRVGRELGIPEIPDVGDRVRG